MSISLFLASLCLALCQSNSVNIIATAAGVRTCTWEREIQSVCIIFHLRFESFRALLHSQYDVSDDGKHVKSATYKWGAEEFYFSFGYSLTYICTTRDLMRTQAAVVAAAKNMLFFNLCHSKRWVDDNLLSVVTANLIITSL